MYKLPRRSPRRKIHKVWNYLLSFFLAYCLVSFAGSFFNLYKMNQELAGMQEQIAKLDVKNTELRKSISRVQSDEYVEMIAREQLGLVKRNETLIITTDSAKKPGVWKVDMEEGGSKSSRVTD